MRLRIVSLPALLVVCATCVLPTPGPVSEAPTGSNATSTWALDLVHTRPGMQADYLRGITANWAGARRLARERGVIRSYYALAAAPDSTRGWDVVLLTEYVDSAAFSNREAIFREIFELPTYQAGRITTDRPSADLRTFVASGVALAAVAGSTR